MPSTYQIEKWETTGIPKPKTWTPGLPRIDSHAAHLPENTSFETKDPSAALSNESHHSSSDGDVSDLEKQGDESSPGDAQREADQAKVPDSNLIIWDGPNDPENAQNWSSRRKWFITTMTGLVSLVCTVASSIFSNGIRQTAAEFHVSTEVTTLGTSLFLAGFIVGPMIWGPSTEIFGRKKPLFVAYILFAIFQIPVAVAQNLQTIFVCRFFGGVFAVAPLVITPGILADMFDPIARGQAMCVFSGSVFVGPYLSPIFGGFIAESYLGWRWTAWITLIMAAFFGVIGVFAIPETYGPVILQARAKRIRFETKNWAIHAKLDETRVDPIEIVTKYFTRPCMMLVQEPILLLMSVYLALVYGLIYLLFTAFPISFQQQRGWSEGVGGLPFISLCIGSISGLSFNAWFIQKHYAPIFRRDGKVPPEERLLAIMIGGILIPIGLFWWGWTSFPSITPWPQIIACVPIAAGLSLVFLQGLNYIIDAYLPVASSAIAANTILRSASGAGFPMFAAAMFGNLGVPWATSLLAFLSLALAPVPFLFYIYGARLRKRSKYGTKF